MNTTPTREPVYVYHWKTKRKELAAPVSMTPAEHSAAIARVKSIREDIGIAREALRRIFEAEQQLSMLGLPECVHDDMVSASGRLNVVMGNPSDGAEPHTRTLHHFEKGLAIYEANLPEPTRK